MRAKPWKGSECICRWTKECEFLDVLAVVVCVHIVSFIAHVAQVSQCLDSQQLVGFRQLYLLHVLFTFRYTDKQTQYQLISTGKRHPFIQSCFHPLQKPNVTPGPGTWRCRFDIQQLPRICGVGDESHQRCLGVVPGICSHPTHRASPTDRSRTAGAQKGLGNQVLAQGSLI